MCGIAGIASLNGRPVDVDEARVMCRALVHRGPDDEGIYLGRGVALGMRRLSIIDLATGDQPIRNEDGTVWVVFNGEIYNFAELRAELEGRAPRIERYWDLHFVPERGRSEEYFVERLRELLEESVRLHLVSDVPLGAFLSGGIDSSSVVATMAQRVSTPVKTFSIGFTEAKFSEVEYARLVAGRFATEHHELILEPDVLDILDELARYLDEPFGDPSAIPTYMVSKLASEHVKVVLSGDGGDELFAGYDRYVVEARERRAELPPVARRLLGLAADLMPDGMRGRNFLGHFSLAGAARYLDALTLFRHDAKRRLFWPEILEVFANDDPWRDALGFIASAPDHWLSALQYLDIKTYLPLDILTKVDRMSMAHSLEARVPLLDHKLIEFAATIPPELQLRGGATKYIFKRAMRSILPSEIIDRPKRGFAVPLAGWFRGPSAAFLRDLLLSVRSRQRGIFNADAIERLIARQASGRALDWQLWMLVSFEMWFRTFLDGRATPGMGHHASHLVSASHS